MRFGALDARDIGVTNFRAPRAASSINRDLQENTAARALKEEVNKDREWRWFVEHWISEGHGAEKTLNALGRAKMYMRLKNKRYSLKFRLRWTP
jgi:hypothetical protein